MGEGPGEPVTVCSECGAAPGGAVMPRRWVWVRRLAAMAAIVAWLGSLVVTGLRATSGTFGYGPWWSHQYPCNAADVWLEQAAASPDASWLRGLFRASWPAACPILSDEPLEIAVCGTALDRNLTPWAPSSMTAGRLMSADLTDAEFARIARDDLERSFGQGWDTPGQTNIAWRASLSEQYENSYTHVQGWPSGVELVRVQRLAVPEYQGREIAWGRPAWQLRHGWLNLRFGDVAETGRAVVMEFWMQQVWVTIALLGALLAAAWSLAPPVWWRLRRQRRSRRGECLDCGYPLPRPS